MACYYSEGMNRVSEHKSVKTSASGSQNEEMCIDEKMAADQPRSSLQEGLWTRAKRKTREHKEKKRTEEETEPFLGWFTRRDGEKTTEGRG